MPRKLQIPQQVVRHPKWELPLKILGFIALLLSRGVKGQEGAPGSGVQRVTGQVEAIFPLCGFIVNKLPNEQLYIAMREPDELTNEIVHNGDKVSFARHIDSNCRTAVNTKRGDKSSTFSLLQDDSSCSVQVTSTKAGLHIANNPRASNEKQCHVKRYKSPAGEYLAVSTDGKNLGSRGRVTADGTVIWQDVVGHDNEADKSRSM